MQNVEHVNVFRRLVALVRAGAPAWHDSIPETCAIHQGTTGVLEPYSFAEVWHGIQSPCSIHEANGSNRVPSQSGGDVARLPLSLKHPSG
jgi:hypothetical protein